MTPANPDILKFLSALHPYDTMHPQTLPAIANMLRSRTFAAGETLYEFDQALDGLFLIVDGTVEISDAHGNQVSQLGPNNSFGERGLLRGGIAVTSARALTDCHLYLLPTANFHDLLDAHSNFAKFYDRARPTPSAETSLATSRVDTLMVTDPKICSPDLTAQGAAQSMNDKRISSLCVVEQDKLIGIVTTRDLSSKVLATNAPYTTPVSQIMTPDPITLSPSSIGSDVLHMMMERKIGHVPICDAGKLVGIVSQTDLTRFQAISSGELVSEIAHAADAGAIAQVTARIPKLLMQLVGAGNRHEVVTRLITDIADTATRRLLALAEAELGAPPVPYVWLACGSQGRQEQTGVSDQDNCLIIDDAMTEADAPYFEALAQRVCDGLNTCGYVYCPGDMMASNLRWRQPLSVWRDYFRSWIAKPDGEAQMLASVMFDLRVIGGTEALFENLHQDTLKAANENSIFVAHMISNSLKHMPPLGLFRGFATIRSGEHKHQIDMKHNGVVPVVDLGRIYALQGQLLAANTRARLHAAQSAGVLSSSGAHDLLDAYDLIAEARLAHQAQQIKIGETPDNYLLPSNLSDFERSHLRDAFVVIKTMQSAIGHGRGMLS